MNYNSIITGYKYLSKNDIILVKFYTQYMYNITHNNLLQYHYFIYFDIIIHYY